MMKKYNKPEIVTLALDMVDVIETSSVTANAALEEKGYGSNNQTIAITTAVTAMNDTWSW